MKALRKLLVCPDCHSSLKDKVFETMENEVISGVLFCEKCETWFPIESGIPRMLPPELYDRGRFIQKYSDHLPSGLSLASEIPAQVRNLEKSVISGYDEEYRRFPRLGFEGEDPEINEIAHEEPTFEYKSLLSDPDLAGSLCLDAGCGNGRYSYWAYRKGAADVVALDFSSVGTEMCRKNCSGLAGIHPVQGDILKLPFLDETFDRVYSIGVLASIDDTQKAISSLGRVVKLRGTLSVHSFQKKNFIYEFVDRFLRSKTTKMPKDKFLNFVQMVYRIAKFLDAIRLHKAVTSFIRLDAHRQSLYNWYATPIAKHFTYQEWFSIFREMGFDFIADRRDINPSLLMKILLKIHPRDAVTIKVKKTKVNNEGDYKKFTNNQKKPCVPK